MARVTGPLFSQTAAGNMAKGALQFKALPPGLTPFTRLRIS
jgi:hypothetical protein